MSEPYCYCGHAADQHGPTCTVERCDCIEYDPDHESTLGAYERGASRGKDAICPTLEERNAAIAVQGSMLRIVALMRQGERTAYDWALSTVHSTVDIELADYETLVMRLEDLRGHSVLTEAAENRKREI